MKYSTDTKQAPGLKERQTVYSEKRVDMNQVIDDKLRALGYGALGQRDESVDHNQVAAKWLELEFA